MAKGSYLNVVYVANLMIQPIIKYADTSKEPQRDPTVFMWTLWQKFLQERWCKKTSSSTQGRSAFKYEYLLYIMLYLMTLKFSDERRK